MQTINVDEMFVYIVGNSDNELEISANVTELRRHWELAISRDQIDGEESEFVSTQDDTLEEDNSLDESSRLSSLFLSSDFQDISSPVQLDNLLFSNQKDESVIVGPNSMIDDERGEQIVYDEVITNMTGFHQSKDSQSECRSTVNTNASSNDTSSAEESNECDEMESSKMDNMTNIQNQHCSDQNGIST